MMEAQNAVASKQESGNVQASLRKDLDVAEDVEDGEARISMPNPACDDDVDWESIAEYLSQCQMADGVDITAINLHQHEETRPRSVTNHRSVIPHHNGIKILETPSKTSIFSRSPAIATPSPSSTSSPSNPGLSTGAKAGIAGGIAIGVVIVLATLVTLHTRRRRKKFGYSRAKGKDSMAAELDGHFVVTTWPDHGEASPIIKPAHTRRPSEGNIGFEEGVQSRSELHHEGHIGLRLDRLLSQTELHHEIEGRGVQHPEDRYVVSPEVTGTLHTQPSQIYHPTPQPYQPSPLLNRSPSPEPEDDPYQQHNQRARPSHPLAQLSEAIPPPKLEARQAHSMADYQNAVPLGFANGFVQVGQGEMTPDTPTRTWDSIQPTYELDLGQRFDHGRISEEADAERGLIQAAEEDRIQDEAEVQREREEGLDRVEGDTELPQYEEMPGIKKEVEQEVVKNRNVRENVRWNQATGHYHIDTDSEDEDNGEGTSRSARRELTKEEMG